MQKKYVMAVLTCAAVLLVFSVISVLIGIPTAGFGFMIVQFVLWLSVMPKAWKWAIKRFDPEFSEE